MRVRSYSASEVGHDEFDPFTGEYAGRAPPVGVIVRLEAFLTMEELELVYRRADWKAVFEGTNNFDLKKFLEGGIRP